MRISHLIKTKFMAVFGCLLFASFLFTVISGGIVHAEQNKQIEFFYGQGCSHCAKVETYFESNGFYKEYPINVIEVYNSPSNAQLFNRTMSRLGVPLDERGVPAVVFGERYLIGDDPIIQNFKEYADSFLLQDVNMQEQEESILDEDDGINLAVVIGAAIVDAINPCAFAVLIILLSTILSFGQPRKAVFAGLAFALSIFISYLLMGLGLYTAIGSVAGSGVLPLIIGGLAIVLGLLNLKDYFWYGKGLLMEVPRSWRATMQRIIRSVTTPLGAFFVGFVVSLFLLPCTSGPYIVIIGMLGERAEFWTAFGYLVFYNLIFVSPMLLITGLVYKGFEPKKAEAIRQKRLKTLHLIAGIILIAMGFYLLFFS